MLDLQGMAAGHEAGGERHGLVRLLLVDLQAGPSQGERCHQSLCRSTPSSQVEGAPSGLHRSSLSDHSHSAMRCKH